MIKSILVDTQTSTNISSTTNLNAVSISMAKSFSVFCKVTVNSGPTATSVKLQGSIDGTNWADLTNYTGTISATANFIFNYADPAFDYMRVVYTIGTANLTCVTTTTVKGEG